MMNFEIHFLGLFAVSQNFNQYNIVGNFIYKINNERWHNENLIKSFLKFNMALIHIISFNEWKGVCQATNHFITHIRGTLLMFHSKPLSLEQCSILASFPKILRTMHESFLSFFSKIVASFLTINAEEKSLIINTPFRREFL